MCCCSKTQGLYTLFILGGILIIASTVLVILWPSMYFNILSNQLILTNKSKSFELWEKTPIPMYLELFLYNFTNSEEVFANSSIKPHFEEKGPYVFREYHYKVNRTWHTNGTISYYQRRVWNFEPSMTNGSLSDKIMNFNVIAATVGYLFRGKPKYMKLAVDSVLRLYGEEIVVTKTAEELLFKGYEDKLIETVKILNIPEISIPYDKFGWFYDRNESDTYDGLMSIFTGATDVYKLGDMDLWNREKEVNYYEGECGAVRGGSGELFPPKWDPDNITIFATDVCSAITLRRSGDVEIEGISGSLFVGDDSVFDNGWNYHREACFCPTNTECQPPGARNVSLCRMGAPAFVSFPHFYLAHKSYLEKIDGIVPDKERDEFRMGLEVLTGIPLLVRAQLQINILVQNIPDIPYFSKVPGEIYAPMLWFRQEVRLTEDFAKDAKLALIIPTIGDGVFYSLLAIGIVLVLIGLFVLIKYPVNRTDSHESLVTE